MKKNLTQILIISFVFVGVFIMGIDFVLADYCYVLYPYADPQHHPAIPCLGELPKGFADSYWNSGYNHYRFFKMSNCRCKTNPVGNDYYEFDNVCSFDIFYWPSNLTEKNLPLFFNQCSTCPPGQESWERLQFVDSIINYCLPPPAAFSCTDYIPESIAMAPSDYVSNKLGITPEEYFSQAVFQHRGCSETKGFEIVKAFPEDEYEETTYRTCTYAPCQVLPTCQEKCQKEHPLQEDLSGRCLSSPEPENGYPKALKQDGQYDDCLTGESCYCRNYKPEITEFSFGLDKEYRKHIGDFFFTDDDLTVSEYDLFNVIGGKAYSLTSQAKIFDKDEEDRKYIETHPPDFEILYSWTVNEDTFKPLSKIPRRYTKCNLLDDGMVECKASLPAMTAKKIERGMLLKIKITPKDPYQTGEPKISSPIGVADHLYYFFSEDTNFSGVPTFYNAFLNLSSVESSVWAMNDRTKRIGKAYAASRAIPLPLNLSGWRRDSAFQDRFKKLGFKHNKEKDDKLTLISDTHLAIHNKKYEKEFRELGMVGGAGGYAGFGKVMIFLETTWHIFDFAHEMGHSSRFSQLCDEYHKKLWEQQNNRRVLYMPLRCRNLFPNCCNENNDCGRPESCAGMPYYPDQDSPQPNYNVHERLFEPNYRSIMGAGTIYPIEAKCPLRNCK